jgi:uncharacterized SAM-dependent methyltransferase
MREESRLSGAGRAEPRAADPRFAADVHYYLSLDPRQLPSHYFYDALGSALFEAICELPWYRITRAEMRLLARSAGRIAAAGPFTTLVELGPGSGQKMLTLLESDDFQESALDVHLIDVSARALTVARETLASVNDVRVVTHEAPYEVGLAQATAERRRGGRALASGPTLETSILRAPTRSCEGCTPRSAAATRSSSARTSRSQPRSSSSRTTIRSV